MVVYMALGCVGAGLEPIMWTNATETHPASVGLSSPRQQGQGHLAITHLLDQCPSRRPPEARATHRVTRYVKHDPAQDCTLSSVSMSEKLRESEARIRYASDCNASDDAGVATSMQSSGPDRTKPRAVWRSPGSGVCWLLGCLCCQRILLYPGFVQQFHLGGCGNS